MHFMPRFRANRSAQVGNQENPKTIESLPNHEDTASLPFHHRDPFDRMLIAQSLTENIPIVSGAAVFDAYGVIRLWDPHHTP